MPPVGRERFIADVVVTCDEADSVHGPGVVDIEDGRICWVGPKADAPEACATMSVNDIGGLLMPGLVNSHCHTPMTLVRGVGDGLPLQRWLTEAIDAAASAQFVIRREDVVLYQYHTAGETDIRLV